MRTTVLYIMGAGNSGSTILSMALGAHSQIFSAGELSQIDRYRALDLTCTCGSAFSQCSFWTSIENASKSACPAPVSPVTSVYQLLRYRKDSIRRDPYYLSVISRNIELYRQIQEVSGKSFVVDASKDPVRLYYLYSSGQLRLVPLHMVRDGRAYVDSMRRRGGMSTRRATFRWAGMNLRTDFVLRLMRCGDRALRVDYDRFTQEPEGCLIEVCERLELDYEAEMLKYYEQTFHNIAGTRSRFSLKPISPYESWRDRLPKSSLTMFALCGGHYFNRRFGVHAG